MGSAEPAYKAQGSRSFEGSLQTSSCKRKKSFLHRLELLSLMFCELCGEGQKKVYGCLSGK